MAIQFYKREMWMMKDTRTGNLFMGLSGNHPYFFQSEKQCDDFIMKHIESEAGSSGFIVGYEYFVPEKVDITINRK